MELKKPTQDQQSKLMDKANEALSEFFAGIPGAQFALVAYFVDPNLKEGETARVEGCWVIGNVSDQFADALHKGIATLEAKPDPSTMN